MLEPAQNCKPMLFYSKIILKSCYLLLERGERGLSRFSPKSFIASTAAVCKKRAIWQSSKKVSAATEALKSVFFFHNSERIGSRYVGRHTIRYGRGGLGRPPRSQPKTEIGIFNLPDLSRHFGISRDGHPDLLKSLR